MSRTDHFDHLPESVRHRIAQQTGGHQPLPDALRRGLEGLTGFDMSHVRVHYNSHKPTEQGLQAFSSGHDIYLAPGQERHLAHEAWHVVQQGHHGPLHKNKPRTGGHHRPHGHGRPHGHKHPGGGHGQGKPGDHGRPHDHHHKHPTHGQGHGHGHHGHHGHGGHKAGSAAHEAHVMGHRAMVHGHHHKG